MSYRRCPVDGAHRVVSWGTNRSGTRRFRCLDCSSTFTPKRSDLSRRNRLPWLESWLRGSTVSSIASSSRQSPKTIKRAIRWYLDHAPAPNPMPIPNPRCHLIIDGTWFGRDSCLLVYWDHDKEHAQRWRYGSGERALEVWEDLRRLKEEGVIPASATSDGSPGIVRAVSIAYPDIPHQRCITHLQRHTLVWITRKPRTQAGREIKRIIRWLSQVTNRELKGQWLGEFNGWRRRWEEFLGERTYAEDLKDLPKEERESRSKGRKWWYTHKQLRRVRSTIQSAIPNLFHYLDDPTIPKTSNELEGRFSSLKDHYRRHKGLSKERRGAYLSWYIANIINV